MAFIVVIHVIACLLLVVTILMQSGRGGGLAESFSSAESMFGTQTNAFMVRLSTILAIIFFSTSLILAINATKADKSLMAKAKLPTSTTSNQNQAVEAPVKGEEGVIKVEAPQPINEADPVAAVTTNTVK